MPLTLLYWYNVNEAKYLGITIDCNKESCLAEKLCHVKRYTCETLGESSVIFTSRLLLTYLLANRLLFHACLVVSAHFECNLLIA